MDDHFQTSSPGVSPDIVPYTLDSMNPYEQISSRIFLVGDKVLWQSFTWESATYPASTQDYPCIWDRSCWLLTGYEAE